MHRIQTEWFLLQLHRKKSSLTVFIESNLIDLMHSNTTKQNKNKTGMCAWVLLTLATIIKHHVHVMCSQNVEKNKWKRNIVCIFCRFLSMFVCTNWFATWYNDIMSIPCLLHSIGKREKWTDTNPQYTHHHHVQISHKIIYIYYRC